jgi:glutathione S-transferase
MRMMESGAHPPIAPPFLKDGDLVIGQTSTILLYLGARHDLAPRDPDGGLWTQQIQLTIADLVNETHDTHHPIGVGLFYEDQKVEALRRAADFRHNRIPKFLGWFDAVLSGNPSGDRHLVGSALTYADLSLFQVVAGLSYAFPKTMREALERVPRVVALAAAVSERPRVRAYLESNRRLPFNQQGIFRHYPELEA